MAETQIIELLGLKELEKRLSEFVPKLERKILVQSMQAGARTIQKEARELAPVSVKPHILKSYASSLFKKYTPSEFGAWIRPGNLRRMIRVKIDKSQSRGYAITYEVFVRNKEAWYWKFVEFGTEKWPLSEVVSGNRPFMRTAFENMKEIAIKVVEEEIRARLESEGITK